MKRFIVTLVSFKLSLALGFVALFVSSETGRLQALKVAPAPTPTLDAKDNIDRKTSTPYTGDLSIFEDAERDKNLQVERVMDILKITDMKAVADIGAGSGWFTVRAAKRVGPGGQVFAVEINQEFIDHILARAKRENFTNIKAILGKADNPMLAANSVDAVLILKTYHEIADPIRFLKNIKPSLRKGGLVGIIDRNGSGADHGLDKETVVKEAKLAGFVLKEEHDFVKPDKMDYFLVFEPFIAVTAMSGDAFDFQGR